LIVLKGAQIIVFNEDGLIVPPESRQDASRVIEKIPDPYSGEHNPCDQADQYKTRPILLRLSCMAKNNKIYVVADMGDYVECSKSQDNKCPIDNHYQFNTIVAFDLTGKLLMKYHKMQLWYEYYYDLPPRPD